MIVLEWEKAYNMIFSYVLLRLVITIIFTHMLHFSASNKTVVNMEQKRYHDSTLIRINVHCWNNFFLQYLPVTSHIALRKRTKKMVRRLKYRQLVSLMVLWLTLVWLRWFSCFNCSARLRPVYEKNERRKKKLKNNYRRLFFMLRPSSRSVNFIFNIYIFSLTSKRNNGLNLNSIFSSRCCWLKQIITVEVMYSILRQKWKKENNFQSNAKFHSPSSSNN